MKELEHIDSLCGHCGYFTSNTNINGGHGCNHKDCYDGEYTYKKDVIDYFNAYRIISKNLTKRNIKCNRRLTKKFLRKAYKLLDRDYNKFGIKFQGVCCGNTCPLGYVAEREDFIEFGENPNLMSEGEWLVIKTND